MSDDKMKAGEIMIDVLLNHRIIPHCRNILKSDLSDDEKIKHIAISSISLFFQLRTKYIDKYDEMVAKYFDKIIVDKDE